MQGEGNGDPLPKLSATLFRIIRSTLLVPWTHVAAPYYIVDTCAMAVAFMGHDHIVRRRLKTKWILFIREKWPYLLHHIFVAIGYPVVVVS